jgi:type VI secretion system Hcp family effector
MRSARSQPPRDNVGNHHALPVILLRIFILFAGLSAFIARADYNAFLYIPGIQGESTDASHTNWIVVNSFTEQAASVLFAPGLTNYSFKLTKPVDKSSPLLAERVADRLSILFINLQLVDTANSNHTYSVTFSNVHVAAISQAYSAADGRILDDVQFRFQTETWTYTYVGGTGKPQTVSTYWDVKQTNGTLPNQTYQGNGDTSAGGAIGGGTLVFTNDATNIYGTLTKGAGTFSNALVLYIDSDAPGFVDTSGFGDIGTGISRAVSGFNGGANRSLLTFTNATKPFMPSYAIALVPLNAASPSGTVFRLQNGGTGSMVQVDSANLAPTGTGNANTYTFSFGMSQIGLPTLSGQTFRFLGSYVTTTGSRSTEAIGSVSGTAGWNPFATLDVDSYTTTAPAATPVAISITFDPQASTLKFSWPVTSIQYVLQQNWNVASTNWADVTNSTTVVSNQNTVVVPAANFTPSFYRLKH